MRMAQKGYSVLVVEQGRRWEGDSPDSDWEVTSTVWNPSLRLTGKRATTEVSFLSVLHGVGLGGSSLDSTVHLGEPPMSVFKAGSWAGHIKLEEMERHFAEVRKMLGVCKQPFFTECDFRVGTAVQALVPEAVVSKAHTATFFGSQEDEVIGCENLRDVQFRELDANPDFCGPSLEDRAYHVTRRQAKQRRALGTDGDTAHRGRAVWADPYFGGIGPQRSPCVACGQCAMGCNKNAKNSLDLNYAFLAEKRYNATFITSCRATGVRYLGQHTEDDDSNYIVDVELREEVPRLLFPQLISPTKLGPPKKLRLKARKVIISCGTVETNRLLLMMKEDQLGLPHLSDHVGSDVRSPSCNSVICTALDETDDGTPMGRDFTKGVTTTSVVQTSTSRLEVKRFGPSSSASRWAFLPLASGANTLARLSSVIRAFVRAGLFSSLRWLTRPDWPQSTIKLCEINENTATMRVDLKGEQLIVSEVAGEAPHANSLISSKIAHRIAADLGGGFVCGPAAAVVRKQTITSDIVGGACIGRVVNERHEVIGYPGLFVIDASNIAANLGTVDSTLTVCALAERAASFVPVSGDGPSKPKLYNHNPWHTVEQRSFYGSDIADKDVKSG
ncbi:GMC oxidoreductase [Diplonema papillatum]|nr:GMC oxidoreductase [Diplonema papillatum]